MSIETLSETNCFGGRIGFYRHASGVNDCDMRFSVFVPPQAHEGKVPVLTFLSGLTCTEENFMVKSGAQRVAAELGLMLVSPDTSPRGDGVPDDPDGEYDFGLGAGFYVNATQEPWSRHYTPSRPSAPILGHRSRGNSRTSCSIIFRVTGVDMD